MEHPSTDDIVYQLAAHPEPGKYEQIPLTESEYTRIREAREFILTVVLIEEKFGMLLENLFEFEQMLLDVALRYMVFANWDYRAVTTTLFLTTRRLQNLLSSARMYLDQVRHDLTILYGKASTEVAAFVDTTHREYDSRLGYRVMEALRNYMQHRSLPLPYVTVGWRREKVTDPVKHIANPELDVKHLRDDEDGGFKPKVLEQLEALGQTPKLKLLVRDYVEGLAVIQVELRSRLEQDVERAKGVLSEARGHFVEKTGKEARFLHLNKRSAPLQREETYLGPELIEQLQRLQAMYSHAQYITNAIVSSEA